MYKFSYRSIKNEIFYLWKDIQFLIALYNGQLIIFLLLSNLVNVLLALWIFYTMGVEANSAISDTEPEKILTKGTWKENICFFLALCLYVCMKITDFLIFIGIIR